MNELRLVIPFIREHMMFVVAAIAALVSMIIVPPDGEYLNYFDLQTIGCLFCVLAVANALRRIGAFDRIARSAIEHDERPHMLSLAIILVTAAFSMAFTNDVALIIMLPLSATMLVKLDRVKLVPIVFSLQALAANLCGMITPFGNPQNLYLYSRYHLGLGEFLVNMEIPFAISLVGIIITTWMLVGKVEKEADLRIDGSDNRSDREKRTPIMPLDSRRLKLYCVLFVLALLAVFRIIPVLIAVCSIACALLFADRKALAEVDYALLLTFICFFIFAGNVSRIPELGMLLGSMMDRWGLLTSALTSQVISNVPAAVILSHFTNSWQELLVGVNIGGAGTFVGSLASLIAIRYFSLSRKAFPALRTPDAPSLRRFVLIFGTLNIAFFVILLIICQFIFTM